MSTAPDLSSPARRVAAEQSDVAQSRLRRGGRSVDHDELAAAVADAYATTKQAFSASVVELCGALGIDAGTIAVSAGLASGESAITAHRTVAPRSLAEIARSVGVELPIIEAARRTDTAHLAWIANRVEALTGRSVAGLRVAIWGLTTAAIATDLASSPAARVADLLVARGAEVAAHDPRLRSGVDHRLLNGVEVCATALNACVGASALVVLEPWEGIDQIDLAVVASLLSRPVVLDVRGALDSAAMRRAGL